MVEGRQKEKGHELKTPSRVDQFIQTYFWFLKFLKQS
jgi:hypothetical protein